MIVVIKYCDCCGKEADKLESRNLRISYADSYRLTPTELCAECLERFEIALMELLRKFREGIAMRGGKL